MKNYIEIEYHPFNKPKVGDTISIEGHLFFVKNINKVKKNGVFLYRIFIDKI